MNSKDFFKSRIIDSSGFTLSQDEPENDRAAAEGQLMSRKLSRGPYGFSAGSKGCVMANLTDDQA